MFAAAKGRGHGRAFLKEIGLTYPHILVSDCVEGGLWTESERNTADSGSRGGPLQLPAPRRAWVHEFFEGDKTALDRRLAEPIAEDPIIDEPLPHQLPWDASLSDLRDAASREVVMRKAVQAIKAPWLSGPCFRGHRAI